MVDAHKDDRQRSLGDFLFGEAGEGAGNITHPAPLAITETVRDRLRLLVSALVSHGPSTIEESGEEPGAVDPRTLAAYIDATLDKAATEALETRLLSDPELRADLAGAQAWVEKTAGSHIPAAPAALIAEAKSLAPRTRPRTRPRTIEQRSDRRLAGRWFAPFSAVASYGLVGVIVFTVIGYSALNFYRDDAPAVQPGADAARVAAEPEPVAEAANENIDTLAFAPPASPAGPAPSSAVAGLSDAPAAPQPPPENRFADDAAGPETVVITQRLAQTPEPPEPLAADRFEETAALPEPAGFVGTGRPLDEASGPAAPGEVAETETGAAPAFLVAEDPLETKPVAAATPAAPAAAPMAGGFNRSLPPPLETDATPTRERAAGGREPSRRVELIVPVDEALAQAVTIYAETKAGDARQAMFKAMARSAPGIDIDLAANIEVTDGLAERFDAYADSTLRSARVVIYPGGIVIWYDPASVIIWNDPPSLGMAP